MKKTIGLLVSMFIVGVFAGSNEVLSFVQSSIVGANCKHFGLESVSVVSSLELGEKVSVKQVDNDSLRVYPQGTIAVDKGSFYQAITLKDKTLFFVLVNKEGKPVSMGYRQLAIEFNKMVQKFDVVIEDIILYEATQINSFLFAIPVNKARGEKNLTVLRPGWDLQRTPLQSEKATVASLQAIIEGE